MRSLRPVLLIAVLASAALLSGCEWLLLWGGTSGGYIATGPDATKAFTDMSNSAGAANVGHAVETWLDRGQLPMPVLAEGSHNFSVRVGSDQVDVKGSRGARRVALFDNGAVVAEYVVAWDKTPEEYRVVSATNRLYDAPLDVASVPVLTTYTIN